MEVNVLAVMQIRLIGDPVLRSKSRQVNKITEKTKDLLSNMADTMYNAQGVGLAAPQVGVLQRIIIIDVEDGHGLIELINPEIIYSSEEKEIMEEGCLSIPGRRDYVIRPDKVEVKGLKPDGKEVVIKADGLKARALQHEIDHLEGVLFIDKVAKELK
jgi:peptide deformylase